MKSKFKLGERVTTVHYNPYWTAIISKILLKGVYEVTFTRKSDHIITKVDMPERRLCSVETADVIFKEMLLK